MVIDNWVNISVYKVIESCSEWTLSVKIYNKSSYR